MFLRLSILILLLKSSTFILSQHLQDYIRLGTTNSYSIQLASNEYKIATVNYRVFKTSSRPTLSVNGSVPVYNKDNFGITQPDGTIRFLRRSQNYSNAGFSISQPIPFTGGTVSLNTDLYRFDDFVANTKQYNGTPVFLQLQQPLFGYNSYKWDKQIEPLRLEESRLALQYEKNRLAYDICKAFFDVLDAQSNKKLALTNLDNCLTNLAAEKRKIQLGTSTEDKALQLEIQELNSRREAEAAELSIQSAFIQLRFLINSTDTALKELILPKKLPVLELDINVLLKEAQKNLPVYIGFQRKLLEAKSNTNQVKAQNNQVNLTVSYGLTNTAVSIPAIYRSPRDQQRFSLGFSVPLITWGKRKNSIAAAKLQESQIELSNKAEGAKLAAEITTLVLELPLLQKNAFSALRIDTLTQKRFLITNRLFQSGKVSLSELQISQNEKDMAKRNYLLAMRRFWEAWYLLQLKANTGQ